MSNMQVEMQVPTLSASSNTDGRTYVTKNELAAGNHLSAVDARRAYDGMTSIGEALADGWWVSDERHEVVRTGERDRIPFYVRSAVWFRDRGRCEMCAEPIRKKEWELDHIVPWSAGGGDDTTNLRVLCVEHNQSRGNHRTPVDARPRMAATWWCDRCYGLDAAEWTYAGRAGVECPSHKWRRGVCPVSRNYDWAARNPDSDTWFNWHQRQTVIDPTRTAFCAHCAMPGVTDVVL